MSVISTVVVGIPSEPVLGRAGLVPQQQFGSDLRSSASTIENIRNFGALPIVLAAFPLLAAYLHPVQGYAAAQFAGRGTLLASFGTWAATQMAHPQRFFDYAIFNDADWQTFFPATVRYRQCSSWLC